MSEEDMLGPEWLDEIRRNIAELYQASLTILASDAQAKAGVSTAVALTPANLVAVLAALDFPILSKAIPELYTAPVIGIGVYGTPIVEESLLDNIAFTVNMATATDKTVEDTSSMAAFIGISNSADTPNNKMQGLLVSNMVHGDCFDAYAVQGHLTIHNNMTTKYANAHLTGLSGKALLTANVEQGWVTGVLAIIDATLGSETVTGLCHAMAAQVEANVGANVVDAVLYLGADAAVPTVIEVAGVANLAKFLSVNAVGGFLSESASLTFTKTHKIAIEIAGVGTKYIQVGDIS